MKKAILLTVVSLIASPVMAQEAIIQLAEPVEGSSQTIILAEPAGGAPAAIRSFVSGGGGAIGYSMFPYWAARSPEQMLGQKQFQDELDLQEEQIKKIAEIRKQAQEKQREVYKGLNEIDARKRGEFIREMQLVNREFVEKEIEKVLLPHQVKRMTEIQTQMSLKSQGTWALRQGKLAEALGITKEQQAELQKKAMEAQRKIQEETAKLKAKLEAEILEEVLSKDQRAKLNDLQGDKYEVKPFQQPGRLVTPGSVTPRPSGEKK